MSRYANAADVLPPRLFKEVQERHSGFLYVPAGEQAKRGNTELIVRLAKRGLNVKTIAATVGVTERRVRQALQKHAENESPAEGRDSETATHAGKEKTDGQEG